MSYVFGFLLFAEVRAPVSMGGDIHYIDHDSSGNPISKKEKESYDRVKFPGPGYRLGTEPGKAIPSVSIDFREIKTDQKIASKESLYQRCIRYLLFIPRLFVQLWETVKTYFYQQSAL